MNRREKKRNGPKTQSEIFSSIAEKAEKQANRELKSCAKKRDRESSADSAPVTKKKSVAVSNLDAATKTKLVDAIHKFMIDNRVTASGEGDVKFIPSDPNKIKNWSVVLSFCFEFTCTVFDANVICIYQGSSQNFYEVVSFRFRCFYWSVWHSRRS